MDEVKKIFPNSIAAKDKRTVELTIFRLMKRIQKIEGIEYEGRCIDSCN